MGVEWGVEEVMTGRVRRMKWTYWTRRRAEIRGERVQDIQGDFFHRVQTPGIER